jgi:hypothetical protein
MCDFVCCSILSLLTTNISAPTEIAYFSKSCIFFRKFLYGSLPQSIVRLTIRMKQVPANQCGLWQHQNPLGWAPLATVDKDADHIALVSQLELLLLRDSIWSAHGNSDPPSSNAANRLHKWSPQSLGSPPPTCAALWPDPSHPATKHEGLLSFTQAILTQPEFCQHSSGIYMVVSPNTETDIPHLLMLQSLFCSLCCSAVLLVLAYYKRFMFKTHSVWQF